MIIVPTDACDWRYIVIDRTDNTDYSSPTFDDSSWAVGCGPMGDQTIHTITFATVIPLNHRWWQRRTVTLAEPIPRLSVSGQIDNDVRVYWNGTLIGTHLNPGGIDLPFSFDVPTGLQMVGANSLAIQATGDPPAPFDGDFLIVQLGSLGWHVDDAVHW